MENQLEVIIKNSGLEQSKAQIIRDKFSDCFEIASEWDKKAKEIVVTSEDNTTEMALARSGRMLLRQKRIDIEKTRVALKEQALREGKAIDGIANVLKSLIVPIEEYLEKQEKFVELKRQAEEYRIRAEEERRLEQERVEREEAEKKEQEKIRVENIKLKEEAEAKEKAMRLEREEMEKKLRQEREEANRRILEQKEEADKKIREEMDKVTKAREEKEEAQRLLDAQIECPFCHQKFNK